MNEICYYGNPVLRKKCTPVTEFTSELSTLCDDLVDMMYDYDGVGLAAPQIGNPKRVIAIDVSQDSDQPMILINPEITWKSEEIDNDSEGCLSIPGIRGNVDRFTSISVKSLDVNGKEQLLEKVDGLFARALQHEIDHLNGVMFVDHLSPVKKGLVAGKLKKMARQNKK